MRFDVLVLIVIIALVLADYALTNGFYSGKIVELAQHIYAALLQRM